MWLNKSCSNQQFGCKAAPVVRFSLLQKQLTSCSQTCLNCEAPKWGRIGHRWPETQPWAVQLFPKALDNLLAAALAPQKSHAVLTLCTPLSPCLAVGPCRRSALLRREAVGSWVPWDKISTHNPSNLQEPPNPARQMLQQTKWPHLLGNFQLSPTHAAERAADGYATLGLPKPLPSSPKSVCLH